MKGKTMLEGLMQDQPLTLDRVIRRMETVTAQSQVTVSLSDGIVRTPYGAVAKRIRMLAEALLAFGVGSGDRVASLAFNTGQHLELFLGVPIMGAVLHTINPRLSMEQLRYVLEHGGATVAFVDESFREALGPTIESSPSIRKVVYLTGPAIGEHDEYEEFLLGGVGRGDTHVQLDERMAAGLCYTSGTTGNPKGVLYSHRSTFLHALSTCLVDVMRISQYETILPMVPLFHANGWGLPHAAGMTGANLVLPGRDVSGASVARLIASENVTIASGVPTVLADLLDYADEHPQTLSSLKFVISGGAPLTAPLVEQFAERHDVEVVQGWGMTETSPNVSMSWPPTGVHGAEANAYRVGAGRLNPLVDARIVDTEGRELPWNGTAAGEIQLKSPHAANGYFREPEASAALLDDGWLRTGDLASIDQNGHISLRDRLKDLIKSGGEWIPTVELEHHIRSYPGIKETAVVSTEDERWGERPLAYVVLRGTSTYTEAGLRKHLSTRVPKWWIPDRFEPIPALPLTTIGKVDKKALRNLNKLSGDEKGVTNEN